MVAEMARRDVFLTYCTAGFDPRPLSPSEPFSEWFVHLLQSDNVATVRTSPLPKWPFLAKVERGEIHARRWQLFRPL